MEKPTIVGKENLSIYCNKKVFITGNTGFKGSWLTSILLHMGANVRGFSHIGSYPHFKLLNNPVQTDIGNVEDFDCLKKSILHFKPDIIFHLAAQPIVIDGINHPHGTFTTNCLGTLNLLEICKMNHISAFINVTTDKVYKNKGVFNCENDELGGIDPYSASKVCSEIITNSYMKSFPNMKTLMATARAGNVIGGGDYGNYRLFPDITKQIFDPNGLLVIRMPNAIRPWQHVLDPLYGYLLLGKQLLEGKKEYTGAWNFGPNNYNNYISVIEIIKIIKKTYLLNLQIIESEFKEVDTLKLDTRKSNERLNWNPNLTIDWAINKTLDWYQECYRNNRIITYQQIEEYFND